MSAPTTKTNLAFCLDVIQYQMGQMNHSNGYRTNGFIVDRGHDPRALRTSLPDQYEQYQAILSIGNPNITKDHEKSLGSRTNMDCAFQIFGLRTLKTAEDDLDITLDTLAGDTFDDLQTAFKALSVGGGLIVPSAAVVALNPTLYATSAPNMIHLEVNRMTTSAQQWFPDVRMIFDCSFSYQKTG